MLPKVKRNYTHKKEEKLDSRHVMFLRNSNPTVGQRKTEQKMAQIIFFNAYSAPKGGQKVLSIWNGLFLRENIDTNQPAWSMGTLTPDC